MISTKTVFTCTFVGKFFTKYDEELAATFSAYCGISLYHVSKNHSLVLSYILSQSPHLV